MIGASGFHYGADITLPDDTTKVTLTPRAATLPTWAPAAGRFRQAGDAELRLGVSAAPGLDRALRPPDARRILIVAAPP